MNEKSIFFKLKEDSTDTIFFENQTEKIRLFCPIHSILVFYVLALKKIIIYSL